MPQARVKTKKNKETMDYQQVITVYTDVECNDLITKGWKILFVGVTHVDSQGFNAKQTFILAQE